MKPDAATVQLQPPVIWFDRAVKLLPESKCRTMVLGIMADAEPRLIAYWQWLGRAASEPCHATA